LTCPEIGLPWVNFFQDGSDSGNLIGLDGTVA